MKNVKACIRLLGFIVWTVVLLIPQIILLLFTKGAAAYAIPHLWHRGICFLFGIRIDTVGKPVSERQVVYVSNHLSYLDIFALGSLLRASFVSKDDVRDWPVFGFLASIQQTAFMSRKRNQIGNVAGSLDQMLKDGKSLIIFPEGTSTDGSTVLPFKSSLFKLITATDEAPGLQPVTIRHTMSDGHSVETQDDRDLYAWHGDMTLVPHLWAFLQSRGVEVRIHFHDLVNPAQYEDRKSLARACHEQVNIPFERALAKVG